MSSVELNSTICDLAISDAADGKEAEVDNFSTVIAHRFKNPLLLQAALTHPSFAGTGPGRRGAGRDYERLEFLGDRVLSLVIADWLFSRYPDEPEGDLSKRFAALVQRDTLAGVAVALNLGSHILLAHGESLSGGRSNPAILADAMEAVLGAIYRDSGLEAARTVIHHLWAGVMDNTSRPPQDSKTLLQEWVHAHGRGRPEYVLVNCSGPAHAPLFEVLVRVAGEEDAEGCGSSRRMAEKEAAIAMLKRINSHES